MRHKMIDMIYRNINSMIDYHIQIFSKEDCYAHSKF